MQAGRVMGNLASAMDLPSEEGALVAELKAGSSQAFAELIARYHQPLYSLIARSLQDPADAADVTQDVFIKVFRNIGSFHGQASLRTWLYRIALHEASNQRRWWSRHKRQETALEAPCDSRADANSGGDAQSLGDTLADGSCSPFEQAAQDELREHVEGALRQVPAAFRSVVVLREIEGFTYEEIADVLGVNLGTVKSRLMRGRAVLRELLAPEDGVGYGHRAGEHHRSAAPAPQGSAPGQSDSRMPNSAMLDRTIEVSR
jgi:RNA polymerase sigma-70 factor (ECF subfamily)